MKGIMEKAIPMMKEKLSLTRILHRTLVTSGIGESALAEMIIDFENNLQPTIKLAYLPRYGMVRLRLTATGNYPSLETELDERFDQLKKEVAKYLVTDRDENMEETLGRLLMKKKKTMCTAESCTGGFISQLITSVPGSSAYYEGSYVAYSYAAKEKLLNVRNQTLVENGAVSEEVVKEMATGALSGIGADYVIAVSGILGPGGGMPEKPVGTVWVALGKKGDLQTHKLNLRFDRKRNAEMTALQSMNLLRQFIMNDV
jgi:nicotinamide-nucleotide amidase